MQILWITLMTAGLVTLTAMGGWVILHQARRLAYHWRHAAHVIEDTWMAEPIPGFIGSMMLEDEQEWIGGWNSGAMMPAPPPDDDWPAEQPGDDPELEDVPQDWLRLPRSDDGWTGKELAAFPRWDEPTHIIAPPAPNPEHVADLAAQDEDAAAFMARMWTACAQIRADLAKQLAA